MAQSTFEFFRSACRLRKGLPVSLRSVFPGRGKYPTSRRSEIRDSFKGHDEHNGIVFDRPKGVFIYHGD